MKIDRLAIYHRLPRQGRAVVAGLRGAFLNHQRYNADTDRLVAEAHARETWTPAQWEAWREDQLSRLLRRAAMEVPYYRQQWSERRQKGDRSSVETLANWSPLQKTEVREDPRRFVADDCRISRMIKDQTSGTSGTPIDVWMTKATVRHWYALFEARWRLWYGVSRHDRWAIIGGQLVVPFATRVPPFWVWNSAMNQLYLSMYHLAPDLIPSYLDAMQQYRVEYLYGYTSALCELAEAAIRLNRRLPLRVVITNAEPISDEQRGSLVQAFGCAVRETYSMVEMVAAASECEHGRMHWWPEAGVTEVVEDASDQSVRRGAMMCTGLANPDMPLVRYLVRDRVSVARADTPCPCGRTLPTLLSIDGREEDILFSLDGRRVIGLHRALKERLPIRESQVVQEARDRIRVRIVPGDGYGAATAARIIELLQARLGPANIICEEHDRIPRGANGKFRAAVCLLSADERRELEPR